MRISTLLFLMLSMLGCGDDSLDNVRTDLNSVRRTVDRIEENQESIQNEIKQKEIYSPQLAEELQEIRKELQERRAELVDEIRHLKGVMALRDAELHEIKESERIQQKEKDDLQILDWDEIQVQEGNGRIARKRISII